VSASEVGAQVAVAAEKDVPRTSRFPLYVMIAGVVVVVVLAGYSFAGARASSRSGAGSLPAAAGGAVPAPASSSGGAQSGVPGPGACACCGTGGSSPSVPGAAVIEGGVQRVSIDTATGSWSPSEIALKEGIPTEITFSEGRGCLARVVFPDLGISADLTDGGAVVRLPALAAGEHSFTCGMEMVSGTLVVR
jgi:hypothetical protein